MNLPRHCYDRFSEAAWEAMSDEADRITEQNRTELAERCKREREFAIDAMTSFVEQMSARSIAEIFWHEREFELNDEALSKPDVFGVVRINRTELALLFSAAADLYAQDNAERVTVEDVADEAIESAAEADADLQREDA